MGFRFRPDPLVEDEMQREAALLMAEENGSWHPPMALPNTPRDPEKEAKKKRAMEVLLRNKTPVAPIPSSQNPFAQKVPTTQEMAMTSAAVRHAQTPVSATAFNAQFKEYPDDFAPSQQEMDRQNPFAPTINRAGKELDVDRPSDLPGGEDNPKEPTPEDLNSKPGHSLARQALNQYMLGDDEEKDTRIPTFSDEYMKSLSNASSTNRNIGLMALLARSANQMGSIGGKVADSSGMDQFAKLAVDGTNDSMKYITNMEMEQLKGQQKQSSRTDKTKLLLELAKLDQQRDIAGMNNTTRQGYNNAMIGLRESEVEQRGDIARGLQGIQKEGLDIKRNPPARPLNPIEEEAIRADIKLKEANAQKALKEEAKGPSNDADKTMITETTKDLSQAQKALRAYKGWLAGFDAAKTEAEKINYADFNLKDLQSVEFGSDAINATDEPRLKGYLREVRPMDVFRDGGKVFGSQLGKFREEIQRKMLKVEDRIRNSQKDLRGIMDQGALNYSPKPGSGTQGAPSPLPAGKVRIFDPQTNGTLLIDESDLSEALKEPGVRVIK